MGTRSKTSFIEKRGDKLTHLVSIYQQYDGYIEGVGYEIANYILNKEIVNGIKLGDRETDKKANGFTCLIAQFIRDFKTEIGNLYITTENNIQEYNYDIIFNSDLYFSKGFFDDTINTDEYFEVIVTDWNKQVIFKGTLKELLEFKESYDE